MEGYLEEAYLCDMCNASTMIDVKLSNDLYSSEWVDASYKSLPSGSYWEPGYCDVTYVKITNNNSFGTYRTLRLEAEGAVSSLADVLEVYLVYSVDQPITPDTIPEGTSLGNLSGVLSNGYLGSIYLEAGETVTVAIVFQMQESAGNEYCGVPLDSSLSLKHTNY